MVDANVPARMKAAGGLDLLFISWYPYQGCGSYSRNWQSIFNTLAANFRMLYVGFVNWE